MSAARSAPAALTMPRATLAARCAFAAYALTLFTMTHWPKLKVPDAVPRSDLWIHAGAYGLWTALFLAGAFFPPRPLALNPSPLARALAPRNIWLSLPVAILYCGFDELTQAIPGLSRVAAWDDFGADCVGVLLATALALILSRRAVGSRREYAAAMPSAAHSPASPAPADTEASAPRV